MLMSLKKKGKLTSGPKDQIYFPISSITIDRCYGEIMYNIIFIFPSASKEKSSSVGGRD